jgi:predicted nucleic acid-binding protein
VTTPNASEHIVVDSSGWVEHFGEGPKADAFASYFKQEELLVIPTVIIYEVYKKLVREKPVWIADRFYSLALRLHTVDLDAQLSWASARASLDHRLAMGDAIIYATARACDAQLITSDIHFQGLPGVTLL